ncbi:hypothetical protein [Pseudarthrobacter defluvii]|uniref:hypothetical protein n=1 Tax=Pseudarthrobacter defluvii TaxID=410837 RepID=UPI0027D8A2B1|nr:hypothetical protein [Pseudarthrobacter defluvii]
MKLHKMGPFRRLVTSWAHALTIAVLLFSEVAALNHLSGRPQADWAAYIALNGSVAALGVILWTPATRLLLIAVYGTSPQVYFEYWKFSRLQAIHRRLLRKSERQIQKNEKIGRAADRLIIKREAQSNTMPQVDLRTIWAKESFDAGTAQLRKVRAEIPIERLKIERDIRKAKKQSRKSEQEMIKVAGRYSKKLSSVLNKNL